MEKAYITREFWLRQAVEKIRGRVFPDMPEMEYQVSTGWTTRKQKALGETITPYQGENVTLDDFFPMTIHINVLIKDPKEMIGVLIHECIHGFYGVKGHKKDFGILADKAGFEKPYKEYHPGELLLDHIDNIYAEMLEDFGEFPGKPLSIHQKEKKEKPKTSGLVFCPGCGFEFKAKLKDIDKYGLPTCHCGTHMGLDSTDESTPEQK